MSKVKQAEGVMTLAEMKEFASFGAATQRYIRRALDIGLDRDDALGRWSRDVVEAASIRAQARHYQALTELRERVPEDSDLNAVEPFNQPIYNAPLFGGTSSALRFSTANPFLPAATRAAILAQPPALPADPFAHRPLGHDPA